MGNIWRVVVVLVTASLLEVPPDADSFEALDTPFISFETEGNWIFTFIPPPFFLFTTPFFLVISSLFFCQETLLLVGGCFLAAFILIGGVDWMGGLVDKPTLQLRSASLSKGAGEITFQSGADTLG